jgi:hypothetical protein
VEDASLERGNTLDRLYGIVVKVVVYDSLGVQIHRVSWVFPTGCTSIRVIISRSY